MPAQRVTAAQGFILKRAPRTLRDAAGGQAAIIAPMATKKQRRRREKIQRHEYEYIVETDEGEEVVTPPGAEKRTSPREQVPVSSSISAAG